MVWLQEEAWGSQLLKRLGGPEGAPETLDFLDPLLDLGEEPSRFLWAAAVVTTKARVTAQGAGLKLQLASRLLEVGLAVCVLSVLIVCVRVRACVRVYGGGVCFQSL